MSERNAQADQNLMPVPGMNMDGAGESPTGSRHGSPTGSRRSSNVSQTGSGHNQPGSNTPAGSRRGSMSSQQTVSGNPVKTQATESGKGKDEYGREARPLTEMQIRYPIKEVSKTLELPPEAYHIQTKTPYARRPGYNNSGQDVGVYVNQFRFTSMCAVEIYQYRVDLDPTPKGPGLVKRIWHEPEVQKMIRAQNKNGFLYDGHHLAWSVNRLKEIRVKFDLGQTKSLAPSEEVYYLIIKPTTSVHLNMLREYLMGKRAWDDQILSCMNILDHAIRQGPSERMMGYRRQFYHNDAKTVQLTRGAVEAMKGIYASVRMSENISAGHMGLGINVDVANSAFFVGDQKFLDLVRAWVASSSANHRNIRVESLEDLLKPVRKAPREGDAPIWMESDAFKTTARLRKLKFRVVHKGRTNENLVFCINNILFDHHGNNTARRKTFDWKKDDGTVVNITVENYYLQRYGVKLRYPNLPLVTTTKNSFFPMELMFVDRFNRYPFKLNGNETSEMIKFAVTRPTERCREINESVARLAWKDDQWLRQFNIKVNDGQDRIRAKLLKNPEVQFANKKINPGVSGRWDLRGIKFLKGNVQPLKSWAFAVVDECVDRQTMKNFIGQFQQVYKSHGGRIEKEPLMFAYPRARSSEDVVTDVLNNTGNANKLAPQIIFFVLPDSNQFIYQRIKKNADCRYALLTQMMLAKHVVKAAGQYMSNVCLKVNAKLGGQTSRIPGQGTNPPFFRLPTMMIGIDVSHGSPGENTPSFAAVTASMDQDASVYHGAASTNGFRVEILNSNSLSGIVQEHLKNFKARNGCFPVQIFYLRDGVSDGQFTHVMEAEVPSMRHACSEVMGANRIPKFTVIVATKRHHVRIFPERGDRNGNCLPGTLLEREVTHPFHYDFFLCSHVALQGTARPVHYHVLHDEIKFPVDELQKMLYQQCYTFARATTPVSLHPAVYYAHIVGDRARAHEDIMSQSIMPGKYKAAGHGFSIFGKYEDASEVRKAQSESGNYRPLLPLGGPEARPYMRDSFRKTMWFI